MKTLYALSYSPWSEKARWTLDHHRIAYREVQFTPPFDEPWLRLRTGKWTGNISAPLLLDGRRSWTDSWDIAKHADAVGTAEKLLPVEQIDAIKRVNDLSQEGLDAGRALVLANMLLSDESLREMAPRNLAKRLGPLVVPGVRLVIKRTQRKWGADRRGTEECMATLERSLLALRKELGGREYILGRFTYADITASQILGMVKPVVHPRYRLKPRTRERFTVESIAAKFEDVIAWRDALYARHRSA